VSSRKAKGAKPKLITHEVKVHRLLDGTSRHARVSSSSNLSTFAVT
jgi:hypothetical protein